MDALQASGRPLDYFPKSILVRVSPQMVNEANLEALVPGASYVVELTSKDWCKQPGESQKAGHGARRSGRRQRAEPVRFRPGVDRAAVRWRANQFSLTEDTGIVDVEVYVSGTLLKQFKYGDLRQLSLVVRRIPVRQYPVDGRRAVLLHSLPEHVPMARRRSSKSSRSISTGIAPSAARFSICRFAAARIGAATEL